MMGTHVMEVKKLFLELHRIQKHSCKENSRFFILIMLCITTLNILELSLKIATDMPKNPDACLPYGPPTRT